MVKRQGILGEGERGERKKKKIKEKIITCKNKEETLNQLSILLWSYIFVLTREEEQETNQNKRESFRHKQDHNP